MLLSLENYVQQFTVHTPHTKCIRANTYHLADKEHDECDDFERMSLVVKSRFVE